MSKNTDFRHVDDDADHEAQEYEVGYRKPPKHSRFPPGRSGNPEGRRRKTMDFARAKDPIFDLLLEDVTLSVRGNKRITRPGIEWAMRAMLNNSIKGCHRSFKTLIDATGDRGIKGLCYVLQEKSREITDAEREEALRFIEKMVGPERFKKDFVDPKS
jgi:hypothetical protein